MKYTMDDLIMGFACGLFFSPFWVVGIVLSIFVIMQILLELTT